MNFEKLVRVYVEEAIKLNKYKKSCHIALLIYKKNKVISYGFNQMDRCYFRGRKICSLHAEIDCLRKIKPTVKLENKKYKLVVVKISRYDLKLTDSRPCDFCTQYIKRVGINSVYCSMESGEIKKIDMDSYIPYKICPKIQ